MPAEVPAHDEGWNMQARWRLEATILGVLIGIGLIGAAWLGSSAALDIKQLERTVAVKGLAEREMPADRVIWPIRFTETDNDLPALNARLQSSATAITTFLQKQGFSAEEISMSAPTLVDKQAQAYGDAGRQPFRYAATNTVTVYSTNIEQVRKSQQAVVELGKQGIAITGDEYQAKVEYLFTGLNALKPAMIEEATRNAREVAEKFAGDSQSRLGKIRQASQGQFSIEDRDSNTPYIKKVRVVSTVEYYLAD